MRSFLQFLVDDGVLAALQVVVQSEPHDEPRARQPIEVGLDVVFLVWPQHQDGRLHALGSLLEQFVSQEFEGLASVADVVDHEDVGVLELLPVEFIKNYQFSRLCSGIAFALDEVDNDGSPDPLDEL